MRSNDLLETINRHGLVDFRHAFESANPNLILVGVVDSFKPTRRTMKGSDHLTTVTLREPCSDYVTLNINLFHSESKAPIQLKQNDIFICFGAVASHKFKNYHALKTAQWAVYDGQSLDKMCEGDTEFPTNDDKVIKVVGLYQAWIKEEPPKPATTQITATASRGGTSGRKIVSTYQLAPKTFIDYVGMVVHCEKDKRSGLEMTNLLLTDYSKNPKPIAGMAHQRQSVDVNLLIQCTLFDENSRDCPPLSHGDFVYVKNALCKLSNRGQFELAVRHDNYATQEKVWLLATNDPLLLDLKQRKQEFEQAPKRPFDTTTDTTPMSPIKKPRRVQIQTVMDEGNQNVAYSYVKDLFNGGFEEDHHLKAAIVEYRPKNIADISVKLCHACGVSSDVALTRCKHCDEVIDTIIYRCSLKFKDVKGDELFGTLYGTEDEPIFEGVPIVNLKTDEAACKQVTDFMNALCPPDQEKPPMLNICVKSFVQESSLRFVLTKTKFRLLHG